MSGTHRCLWLARAMPLLVTLLVLASSMSSWGQTFPGEQEPIGASRLIQFPDDELVIISFAPVGSGVVPLQIQEFSPNPDYTVPAGPDATALQPWPQPLGEENIFSNAGVAKGRFVDPARDAVVALTKTSVDATHITWAVQEITFVNGPARTVPTLTFTAPVLPGDPSDNASPRSWDSPGAIAGGDLDRAVDTDGNSHDEIVMVTEYSPSVDSDVTQVELSVIDYAVRPGQATVNASVIGLPSGPMAYPLNISTLRKYHGHSGQAGRPRYPGMLAVTMGDFDGDGTTDIAVVALTFDAGTGFNNLVVHFYKYAPGYTQNPPTHGSLTLMGFQTIAGGPDDPTKPGAFFHGPLSVDRGDVDYDGKDEVIVAFLDDAHTIEPGDLGDLKFWANMYLATVAFDPTSHTITVTKENLIADVEAWYDGLNDPATFNDNPSPRYQDIRVAAGLFKFNPEQGYPLTGRQIVLAYTAANKIQLGLWEQLPPITPGFHNYANVALDFCAGGETNSISLVAGNFAGVKAKQPDTPPVWGLAVAYESAANPTTGVVASVFRVDQGVDWNNGVFPLTPASHLAVGNKDTACARHSRNVLVAFDYDGDGLYLGAPVHFVLNDVQHFDYMLQEPPKHVDYLPNAITTCDGAFPYACNGIVNISEFDSFNIAYGTSTTNTVSHEVQKNSSWGAGASVAFSAQNTVGEDAGIENVDLTADFKTKVDYDYDEHKESYTGQESTYKVSQESVTSGDDALAYQIRTTDIWRYRIYGTSPPGDKDQTLNGFYEIALPRALCTAPGNTDPSNCSGQGVIGGGRSHMELYQPWHENWNILSYPSADTAFHPTDIGPWTRAKCDPSNKQCSDANCTPNKDNPTQVDCTTPLAPPQQFSWDSNEGNQHVQLDSSLTTGSTTEWTSKFSEDFNLGLGWEFQFFGLVANDVFTACLDFDFHSDQSWGELSSASTTTTLTTDIQINKPPGDGTFLYNFFPTLYVDTKGAMRAVHSVTIPSDTAFWQDAYHGVDPALNLPKKFSNAANPNFKQFNSGSDAKEMRGFLLRNGKTDSQAYGTVLGCGPVTLNASALNNQVLLEARIYNYSVGSAVSDVPVRFDVVELDENGVDECSDATACLARTPLATVTATCTNPYNVSSTMCDPSVPTRLSPRGMGLAHYILDISTLPLPSVGLSNQFRFYVVVDPNNKITEETHEWRQPTVVLTPDLRFTPGEQFCVDVQGTSAEEICYTVQGGADDLTLALTDAFNASQTATQYGLKATRIKFDPSNPNESARVIAGAPHVEITLKTGVAQLKPGTEFRAGFLDAHGRPFYFVPATKNLTATNDQPGQNNEGYGARTLTVRVPTAAGLFGGGDPCGGSDGLDRYMASESLAAIDRDGTAHTGRVQVTPGQTLRLRFTAFASDDTGSCEQTQLFLGHPASGGTLLASRIISGIDAVKGGRTGHHWRAPDTPGLYTLYARLHERPTDTQIGNNLATLEVLVVEPNNPNGPLVSEFTGTARHVGSGRANGTVSLHGTVKFAGEINLSAATLTLSQLLNEQNGNGELAQGANGSGFLPLTLLPARHGRQGTWATFKTPAWTEPRVKVEMKQRHAETGGTPDEWELTLTAEDTLISAAAGCSDAPRASTGLTTQLTLNDGTHVPVVMHTTQPWRCRKHSLRAS